MILDTGPMPLLFTNNHVNKHSDISVCVNELTQPRYLSTIKCSSADGVGCMMSIPNLVKIGQTLYGNIAWWLHNPVSQLQEGKTIKNPLLIPKPVTKLSKNSLLYRSLVSFLKTVC